MKLIDGEYEDWKEKLSEEITKHTALYKRQVRKSAFIVLSEEEKQELNKTVDKEAE